MKYNELIIGCYYKWIINDTVYYFRFERYDKDFIYSYGWEIRGWFKEDKSSFHYVYNRNLCYKDICDLHKNIVKVEFSEIVDILPERHPDRIMFNRKRKLKSLLNGI